MLYSCTHMATVSVKGLENVDEPLLSWTAVGGQIYDTVCWSRVLPAITTTTQRLSSSHSRMVACINSTKHRQPQHKDYLHLIVEW